MRIPVLSSVPSPVQVLNTDCPSPRYPLVPISGPVLVHRYFPKLSHFCIRSSIVT